MSLQNVRTLRDMIKNFLKVTEDLQTSIGGMLSQLKDCPIAIIDFLHVVFHIIIQSPKDLLKKIEVYLSSREAKEGNNSPPTDSNPNNDEYNLDDVPLEIYPSNERVSEINFRQEEKKNNAYYTEQPRSQTIGGANGFVQNPQNQFATNAAEYHFDDLFDLNGPAKPAEESNYYATYAKPENYKNPFDDAQSQYVSLPRF